MDNNSFDGDSHLLLINSGKASGLDIRNSPESTDTPNINIIAGSNFRNYSQYFFPKPATYLASAESEDFPNMTWTQVTITRTGNLITDDVGGQVIQATVSGKALGSALQIGLGAYATTYDGGAGLLEYRDITVTEDSALFEAFSEADMFEVPEPSTWALSIFGVAGVFLLRRGKVRGAC